MVLAILVVATLTLFFGNYKAYSDIKMFGSIRPKTVLIFICSILVSVTLFLTAITVKLFKEWHT